MMKNQNVVSQLVLFIKASYRMLEILIIAKKLSRTHTLLGVEKYEESSLLKYDADIIH